jgi:hypothetical protein
MHYFSSRRTFNKRLALGTGALFAADLLIADPYQPLPVIRPAGKPVKIRNCILPTQHKRLCAIMKAEKSKKNTSYLRIIFILALSFLMLDKSFSQINSSVRETILELNVECNLQVSNTSGSFTTLNILYNNVGKTPIFIWLKNWRIILLRNETDLFHKYPFGHELSNFVIICSDSINENEQIVLSMETWFYSFKEIKSSIKRLAPGEIFQISIVSTDSNIFNFLASSGYYINVKLNLNSPTPIDSPEINQFPNQVIYQSSNLTILDPKIECGLYRDLKYYDFSIPSGDNFLPLKGLSFKGFKFYEALFTRYKGSSTIILD